MWMKNAEHLILQERRHGRQCCIATTIRSTRGVQTMAANNEHYKGKLNIHPEHRDMLKDVNENKGQMMHNTPLCITITFIS